MRILILNPPSSEKHLRGNYCSNVSKGVYYYPAIDLLIQSGILSSAFEIQVCDAIAEAKSKAEVLALIPEVDGVFAVTGSSSRRSDLEFFEQMKEWNPRLKLLISGGYLLTQASEVLAQSPFIDGAMIDWSSDESIRFFQGSSGPFSTIVTRNPTTELKTGETKKEVRYPIPRHDLFPIRAYHHPNARRHPFSLLIHSFGCPYTCDYCIYSITPYKARPVSDVIEEIRYLDSLGIHELFFHDPTFAVKRDQADELLEAMARERKKTGWFAQTRVDLMDEKLLTAMKRAGCHALMFGVESADETLLKEHKRRLSHEQTKKVYALCRKLGIRTLSYLILGLPGDTEKTIGATLDFVKEIQSDFVSFNLAIPVIGTGFRENVLAEGLAKNEIIEFDNSSERPTMPTRFLSTKELQGIHAKAIRSFYLRPSYLFHRLASVRSLYEFKNQLREGLALFSKP